MGRGLNGMGEGEAGETGLQQKRKWKVGRSDQGGGTGLVVPECTISKLPSGPDQSINIDLS